MSCITTQSTPKNVTLYPNKKDEELMSGLKSGDKSSFDELYKRYQKPLFYFFYRMLGNNKEKCEDFLQDIFMKIIDKPELFDESKPFKPWIYSVAHNMVKNEYKKLEVRKVMVKDGDTSRIKINGNNPDAITDEELFKQRLFSCLEKVQPENRAAFLMKYHEGFSIEEIAKTLNIKEGTVKSKLFYTKQELAGLLREFKPKN